MRNILKYSLYFENKENKYRRKRKYFNLKCILYLKYFTVLNFLNTLVKLTQKQILQNIF